VYARGLSRQDEQPNFLENAAEHRTAAMLNFAEFTYRNCSENRCEPRNSGSEGGQEGARTGPARPLLAAEEARALGAFCYFPNGFSTHFGE
jgi:hypothetical protein